VVCGPRAIPPTASKPVRPPVGKEGGTGVFLPLAAMALAPAATSSKPVEAQSAFLSKRSFELTFLGEGKSPLDRGGIKLDF
jgi:hypothetical protein